MLVDPYDAGQISTALRSVDADEDLRNSLIQRGTNRARLFSRERYLERLREVYAPFL